MSFTTLNGGPRMGYYVGMCDKNVLFPDSKSGGNGASSNKDGSDGC